jgi:hypothetical protein
MMNHGGTEARGRSIGGHHRGYEGETNTWLTPLEVIEALGEFDLDPCGLLHWPTAGKIYESPTVDGFTSPWFGRVWLNPPYGPHCHKWLTKLADHGQGTALIFARTETAMFFDAVWRRASALLFIEGRLHFHHADGTRAKANSGAPSVLVAYGEYDREQLQKASHLGQFIPLAPVSSLPTPDPQ